MGEYDLCHLAIKMPRTAWDKLCKQVYAEYHISAREKVRQNHGKRAMPFAVYGYYATSIYFAQNHISHCCTLPSKPDVSLSLGVSG